MKSRTSFFDWTTFKKNVTRFRPLWILYTVLMLITILPMLDTYGWSHPALLLDDSLQVMAFLNLVYAGLAASLLFGELFNSRLCNALHAMPVTREARFGSHVTAGLAFALVPNFLIALLAMPALEHLWFTAFLWLSVICLQYVFFFSVGALSAMCAGSRFAMIMVYLLINLLSPLLYWFVDTVFQPSLPGVIISEDPFTLFCPIIQLMQNGDYSRFSWVSPGIPMNLEECTFTGMGEDWLYLGIVALAGVGALVAALLLYRRRNLESAGDFIAVRWLSPVFLALYTLSFSAFFSSLGSLFGMLFDFLLVLGLFLGFFTGKMLLERTTKVFRKKNFLHAGIYAAVLLVMVLTVKIDLLGIVSYVPDAQNVEYITFTRSGIQERDLYSEAQKETVREIHQLALDNYCDRTCGDPHHPVTIEYHLRNGRIIRRKYYLCDGTEAAVLVQGLIKY